MKSQIHKLSCLSGKYPKNQNKILGKLKTISMVWFVLSFSVVYAQDTIQTQLNAIKDEINSLKKEDKTNFMMRGFGQFGLQTSADDANFSMTSFNPVLLWRHGDHFLFESELEMEYMSDMFEINLGYANASYIVSRGLIIRAGKFLLPFGTFTERFHPSWINKFSSTPLGFGHDGIAPSADIGLEIRGGLQLGKSKLNYSIYAVNGPGIKDGTEEPDEAGMLSFSNSMDNNKNKAIGSRIGYLPLANSSLEIGVSGYYAMPGSMDSPFEQDSMNEDITYKDVTAMLTAFDLSYVKIVKPLKGIIDFKGQYNFSNISSVDYFNAEDTSRYTFTNKSSSYYAQLAFRPALAENAILKNMELVGRYSMYDTPHGSLWESNQTQLDIGLNYWFTWRTVVKMSYQITNETMDESEMSGMSSMGNNTFLIHLAFGL